jgi:hypothetical protein
MQRHAAPKALEPCILVVHAPFIVAFASFRTEKPRRACP